MIVYQEFLRNFSAQLNDQLIVIEDFDPGLESDSDSEIDTR